MADFNALKNPGFYNLDCMDDLQIGKAGEYLVCADLILRGFVAYPSEQGLPYDIVLDTEDARMEAVTECNSCSYYNRGECGRTGLAMTPDDYCSKAVPAEA